MRNGNAAILVACLGLFVAGCARERPVWSMEARASDDLRAVAESFVQTGPGANSVDTVVRIERGRDVRRQSSLVLGFADAGKGLVSMKWLTPTRLLIVLKDDPTSIYYQVVKTSGVDISLALSK